MATGMRLERDGFGPVIRGLPLGVDPTDRYQLRELLWEAAASARVVSVDLAGVVSMSTGTFDILAGIVDDGVSVLLLNPEEPVRAFAWFRMFGVEAGANTFELTNQGLVPTATQNWLAGHKRTATYCGISDSVRC